MTTNLDALIESDVELQPYNTMNISARARWFVSVKEVDQLKKVLQQLQASERKLLVLGGGSNVLFADNFDGLVLQMGISGREIIQETPDEVLLKIGAGENWHETVRYCVKNGWGGVENLSLIPGTVGAAPIQNIGAYGVELKDVFKYLEAVQVNTGEKRTFSKEECQFGYRDSIFKKELKGKFIITKVVLKLSKQPEINSSYGAIQDMLSELDIPDPTIQDISDVVMEIRNRKLPNPNTLGNTGSFFKNPVVAESIFERIKKRYPGVPGYPMEKGKVKIPAGWLIEQSGWKGKKVGNAGTYKNQALVIVNHGGATGKEILTLAENIRKSVHREFGIKLDPEVNIIK